MKYILHFLLLFVVSSTISQNKKAILKDWTAYSQTINVSKFEGAEFKVSAYLKNGKVNSKGKSALWVRVDKNDNTTGFFRNDAYDKSKKVTNEWKKFEIAGKIDSSAQTLTFGAFCQGNGDFYFDNFQFQIKETSGKWKLIKLENGSFEKNRANDSWFEGIRKNKIVNVQQFNIIYTKETSSDGKTALQITGKNIIGNNENGKYVNVNNVDLYYEIYGEGEPLLLLHGNGQSISAFMNQIDFFSKRFKVILVDCRGRGNSSFDYNKELTYTLEANDISLFLEKIGIEKTHIFGWSDGGIIGLIMAMKYPEKVNKLIAMGANINPQGLKDLDGMFNTIKELKKGNDGKNDLFISLYKLMAYYPKLNYDDLKVIKAKTLIMAGDRDVIKNVHTIKMYEAIKGAQLAILPNETHYFPEENPSFFNELVLKFLSE